MSEPMAIEQPEAAAQHVTRDEAVLLWQAFSLRGVTEDLPKKSAIAKQFKSQMEPAAIYVTQRDGDVVKKLDPRGGLSMPTSGTMYAFTPEQSTYLGECFNELKTKQEAGRALVDSSVADDVDHIENVLLPRWLARSGDADELVEAAAAAANAGGAHA